jgi:hypothetical protein
VIASSSSSEDVKKAIDLLARQACNCLPESGRVKVLCLRCEVLALLGADSALISNGRTYQGGNRGR